MLAIDPNPLEQLLRRSTNIMTVTRAIVTATMLAGLAVGVATTASADPSMSGHYIRTATAPQSGKSVNKDWYALPAAADAPK
jgi:hypothetical protein